MTGINEADMNRINEFIKLNKFERSPELLCPGDGEEPAESHDSDEQSAVTAEE